VTTRQHDNTNSTKRYIFVSLAIHHRHFFEGKCKFVKTPRKLEKYICATLASTAISEVKRRYATTPTTTPTS
jgi:hypothetical protein